MLDIYLRQISRPYLTNISDDLKNISWIILDVGNDGKVRLETGYRIFKLLIPFYFAGTRNSRLLSGSGYPEPDFSYLIPFPAGTGWIKELTEIPAGILMDLFTLKLKKIRALLVHLISSSNFNRFVGTVKSIN